MSPSNKTTDHSNEWQLQEAKNRLSRVVDAASKGVPQTITLRGTPTAVVLSFAQYQELIRPRTPLSSFFQSSPLRGVDIDTCRNQDAGREVDI